MADLLQGAASLVGDLAAPYALITQAGRSIGGIIPNVTLQEVIVDENTITIHPVQSGAPISDHVFANPVVTDMLVGWSDSTGQYDGYITDIYQAILALRDTRQPFDLYTAKRMIPNVLFGNITSTTDETSDTTLMLRVRLQEVIISDTSTAGGGATQDNQANPQQTGPESNVGNQSLQPTSAESETAASAAAGVSYSSQPGSETAASAQAGVSVTNTNVGDAVRPTGSTVG